MYLIYHLNLVPKNLLYSKHIKKTKVGLHLKMIDYPVFCSHEEEIIKKAKIKWCGERSTEDEKKSQRREKRRRDLSSPHAILCRPAAGSGHH